MCIEFRSEGKFNEIIFKKSFNSSNEKQTITLKRGNIKSKRHNLRLQQIFSSMVNPGPQKHRCLALMLMCDMKNNNNDSVQSGNDIYRPI